MEGKQDVGQKGLYIRLFLFGVKLCIAKWQYHIINSNADASLAKSWFVFREHVLQTWIVLAYILSSLYLLASGDIKQMLSFNSG